MTDTSDDFISNIFGGGGGDDDIPAVKAENVKRTAQPTEQLSEGAARNRRLAASSLTKNFAPPELSSSGLLGL